ncbi:MAG: hypothetical protein AAB424_01040 [Patescibacteria group bacterium]
MHSVIEAIVQRRNKSVPVQDGKKIGLVLYGGVMGGIRGAGAMIALEEMGLAHAFDCIYTNSAGFANASYLLAGATQLGTSIYYEDLASWKFINPFRLWKIVDIDFLISVMREGKHLPIENILASHTKLFVALQNVQKHQAEYLEVHSEPSEQYLELMRAATSIPFLHPGTVNIHDKPYMDIPLHQPDLHIDKALANGCTEVLVIANYSSQLPIGLIADRRVCIIQPAPSWKLARLERQSTRLQLACVQMGTLVFQSFGVEREITLGYAKL